MVAVIGSGRYSEVVVNSGLAVLKIKFRLITFRSIQSRSVDRTRQNAAIGLSLLSMGDLPLPLPPLCFQSIEDNDYDYYCCSIEVEINTKAKALKLKKTIFYLSVERVCPFSLSHTRTHARTQTRAHTQIHNHSLSNTLTHLLHVRYMHETEAQNYRVVK